MKRKQFEKYNKLGLNITYYRRSRSLSQMKLAELIDVDRTHIGKIETAQVGASLDVIFAIADVLDIPVYKLFEFRD